MKKTFIFLLLIVLSVSAFASCTSDNMEDLPIGNLLSTSDSPDGTYRLNAYLCSDKGEMYVRGELVEVSANETRNIYWAKHSETLDIEWTNDTTVVLNEVSLNVQSDTYDCRNEKISVFIQKDCAYKFSHFDDY